jgi:hypothetical protein
LRVEKKEVDVDDIDWLIWGNVHKAHHLFTRFGSEFSFMSHCFPIFFPRSVSNELYRPPVLLNVTITEKMMKGKKNYEDFETMGANFLLNGICDRDTGHNTNFHEPTAAALKAEFRLLGKGGDADAIDDSANYQLVCKGLTEGQGVFTAKRETSVVVPPRRQNTPMGMIAKMKHHQDTTDDPQVLQNTLLLTQLQRRREAGLARVL